MALQGTLDTFGFTDVLSLLAASEKTGRLLVSGDAADGCLFMDGGHVVAAFSAVGELEHSTPVDVVVDLLRCREGSFMFEPEIAAPDAGAPLELSGLLEAAEVKLAAWRDIERVVPSLELWCALTPELPRPEVVIDQRRWKAIVSIGSGCTVRDLGYVLGLDPFDSASVVKELVEHELVVLGESVEIDGSDTEAHHDSAPSGSWSLGSSAISGAIEAETTVSSYETPSWAEKPTWQDSTWAADPVTPAIEVAEAVAAPVNDGPAMQFGVEIPGFSSLSSGWSGPTDVVVDEEPEDDGPVELGNLTPAAARAIAAAAQANNEAERDSHIERAIALNDEPIDRKTLLRFLSSVRT